MKKFFKNNQGNVGTIFAILAMPMLVVTGGAIDILRISNSEAKLQAAVESGALSAASLTSKQSVEVAVEEYVKANVGDDENIKNLKISIGDQQISLNSKRVQVKAEAEIPLTFLQLTGRKTKKISVVGEAIEARDSMEISVVLDISSSMRGEKLVNLKSAAANFVDQMLTPDRVTMTSMNLVPFGGSVNLGEIFDDYVVELGASGVTNEPDSRAYNKKYGITSQKFRFSYSDPSIINKCIELRKEDFDLDSIPEKSRPQIPHFWKWTNFNPWCPEEKSAALWNTNNANDLKKRIAEFTLSDGTGMDHGLIWGAKALSPDFQGKLGGDFPQRPSKFNDPNKKVRKIMVLMTDGGITAQYRPIDPKRQSTHTRGKNNRNQQTLLGRGNSRDAVTKNTAIGNFKAVCDDLRNEDVVIYTIGFKIRSKSLPENLLKYCATNPANYFHVESMDIAKAFNAIVVAVQKLRVSG